MCEIDKNQVIYYKKNASNKKFGSFYFVDVKNLAD